MKKYTSKYNTPLKWYIFTIIRSLVWAGAYALYAIDAGNTGNLPYLVCGGIGIALCILYVQAALKFSKSAYHLAIANRLYYLCIQGYYYLFLSPTPNGFAIPVIIAAVEIYYFVLRYDIFDDVPYSKEYAAQLKASQATEKKPVTVKAPDVQPDSLSEEKPVVKAEEVKKVVENKQEPKKSLLTEDKLQTAIMIFTHTLNANLCSDIDEFDYAGLKLPETDEMKYSLYGGLLSANLHDLVHINNADINQNNIDIVKQCGVGCLNVLKGFKGDSAKYALDIFNDLQLSVFAKEIDCDHFAALVHTKLENYNNLSKQNEEGYLKLYAFIKEKSKHTSDIVALVPAISDALS